MPRDVCSVPISSASRLSKAYDKQREAALLDSMANFQLPTSLSSLQTPKKSVHTLNPIPSSATSPPGLSYSPTSTPASSIRPTPSRFAQSLSGSEPDFLTISDPGPSSISSITAPSKIVVYASNHKRSDGHVKRPANPFILFAKDFRRKNKGVNNRELSKRAGNLWRSMNEIEKHPWRELASEVKKEHEKLYPDYRYQPRRNVRKSKKKEGECITAKLDLDASAFLNTAADNSLIADYNRYLHSTPFSSGGISFNDPIFSSDASHGIKTPLTLRTISHDPYVYTPLNLAQSSTSSNVTDSFLSTDSLTSTPFTLSKDVHWTSDMPQMFSQLSTPQQGAVSLRGSLSSSTAISASDCALLGQTIFDSPLSELMTSSVSSSALVPRLSSRAPTTSKAPRSQAVGGPSRSKST